jgi:hypothetical protein
MNLTSLGTLAALSKLSSTAQGANSEIIPRAGVSTISPAQTQFFVCDQGRSLTLQNCRTCPKKECGGHF